jgi:ABC-type Fe3+-hydroxamate transport system substrate-binding protein
MTQPPSQPSTRIVSLVPSITESLFSLGLGDRVVGVTDWCVHPKDRVARLPKLGGTKNPSVRGILALDPDLVIANHEENRERTVHALRAAGVEVWVTYPRTIQDGVSLLGEIAKLGATPEAIASVVNPVREALRAAEERRPPRGLPVFCPIWKKPWMAVGGDTYISSLLELCGGLNVFADFGDRRYPIVEVEQIVAAAPEVILLPSEPYDFGPLDARELGALAVPAARNGRIHLIDGTLASWYGPRIEPAIATIGSLLLDGEPERIH